MCEFCEILGIGLNQVGQNLLTFCEPGQPKFKTPSQVKIAQKIQVQVQIHPPPLSLQLSSVCVFTQGFPCTNFNCVVQRATRGQAE